MVPVSDYDLFLSYSRRDIAAAETLAARLAHDAGLRLWMDRARLQPGASWRDEIEQAMNAASAAVIAWGPQGLGPVQRQERDLAYALRDSRPGFRVVYALLPGAPPPQGTWANVDTWVRFEGGLDEADPFARLVAALKGEAPPGALDATLPDKPAPYRGLAAFDLDDRHFFFGRSALIAELSERLARHPFLAVVGASGSGKTSLVQAGLLARFAAEGGPAGERVRILVVRPGPRPLQGLAAELARLNESGNPLVVADDLRQRLAAEPGQLPDIVRVLLPAGQRVALVIDRLEEIYTLAESEEEVERFVAALLALARHPHQPAFLLITLRADFYARLAPHSEFAAEVASRQVYVTPLSEAEVAEVIEAPAAVVGAVFEKGLAARVRDDARQRGDVVLPLLQHALDLLWRRRRGRWITWEAYDEIGQVAGALRYHADRVAGSLSGDEQAIARRLVTGLVWIEEGEVTAIGSRRVDKNQLVDGNDGVEKRVLQRLADERLIRLGGGAKATVELIHDSLPLHWESLKRWVNEDREFLLWRQRLHPELAEWERTGRDEGALLRGPTLVEAERWMAERRDDLSPEERELVAASLALRQREKAEREWLRRRKVTGLAAGIVIASGLAFLAGWQWRRAQNERGVAVSRQLAALAVAEPVERLDRALLLAAEGYQSGDTFEAREALLARLTEAASVRAFLHSRGKPAGPVAFSPDGKVFVAALEDGRIERWDVATRQPIGEPLAERAEATANASTSHNHVIELSFGPDGTTLAVVHIDSVSRETTAVLWDLAAKPPVGRRILEHGDVKLEAAVSPDRHRLALLSPESVVVWDLLTRRQVGEPASAPLGPIKQVTFAPDGKQLLVSQSAKDFPYSAKGIVLVTIEAPRPHVEMLAAGALVTSAAWSGNDELALGTDSGEIRRYDLASRAEIGPPLAGTGSSVIALSYPHGSKDLVAVDDAGSITLWDRTLRAPAARPGGSFGGPTSRPTFSPDGHDLIASITGEDIALDSTAVWRMRDGREHGPFRIAHGDNVTQARWSADGWRVLDLPRILTVGPMGTVGVAARYTLGVVEGWTISPDGVMLAILDGARVSLMDLSKDESIPQPLVPYAWWNDFLPSAAWSPNGRWLAWGTKQIALWDVETERLLPPLPGAGDGSGKAMEAEVSALAFSSDGRTLACGREDGTIRLWDIAGRAPVNPPLSVPEKAPITELAFSPDGRRLAVGGSESDIALWDLGTKQWIPRPSGMAPGIGRFKLPEGTQLGLAVSPTRPVAAVADGGKQVALIDLDSGKPLKGLKVPTSIYSVAFHPNGDVLATGGMDGALLLWDIASGELIGAPFAIAERVESLSFDRSGGRLATGSRRGANVLIGNLVHRQRLLPTFGNSGTKTLVALSPNGKKLVTASSHETLLWDLDIAAWPARACRIANRNLSREEWRDALGKETPYRKTCAELPAPSD